MVRDDVKAWTFELLGLSSKSEVLKFIGIGMGGVLIALQALMSYKRAKAMEDTAKAQADAVMNTEQVLRQERMKNAIEHLGHDKDSVRLGGAYELCHLAKDTPELRQTVLDILCAHIRQTTGESAYLKTHQSKPSEEVQSLLTLLFVQEHKIFKGCRINLQGSWLHGADLREARLEKAVLTRAYLQGSDLRKAHLQEADLPEACLQGANLEKAHLQKAHLEKARLHGADLFLAQLHGADLNRAQMQGSNLNGAQLHGAFLAKAQLQGTFGMWWWRGNTFLERIKNLTDQETDLLGVIFEGGLSQGIVDSIVEGLSDDRAKELREELKPHIGKPPSSQLPENSGATTGTYSKEEAEKWIAEYNKAMSTVPTQKENA